MQSTSYLALKTFKLHSFANHKHSSWDFVKDSAKSQSMLHHKRQGIHKTTALNNDGNTKSDTPIITGFRFPHWCDCDTKMCQASTDAVPCRDACYQWRMPTNQRHITRGNFNYKTFFCSHCKGHFPLQTFCPRGRSEHVSTFAIGV